MLLLTSRLPAKKVLGLTPPSPDTGRSLCARRPASKGSLVERPGIGARGACRRPFAHDKGFPQCQQRPGQRSAHDGAVNGGDDAKRGFRCDDKETPTITSTSLPEPARTAWMTPSISTSTSLDPTGTLVKAHQPSPDPLDGFCTMHGRSKRCPSLGFGQAPDPS